MPTAITTIQAGDLITNSRADLNANFSSINANKIETDYLDTDTTLAANSDTKLATQKAVRAYVDSGGNPLASETVVGRSQEATDLQVTNGTATNPSTGAKLFVTPAKLKTVTDVINTNISLKANTTATLKLVGVGDISNTTYENYQIQFGTATTTFGWTSVSTPTYRSTHMIIGSAQGVRRAFVIDLATGLLMTYANTKILILEWDAKINSDTTTGLSFMGLTVDGVDGTDSVSVSRRGVAFYTDDGGAWFLYRGNGTNNTLTSISTPSVGKHTFRIEYNPVTPLATFYIDGVSVGTHSSGMPTSQDIGLGFANFTSSIIIGGLSAINVSIQK